MTFMNDPDQKTTNKHTKNKQNTQSNKQTKTNKQKTTTLKHNSYGLLHFQKNVGLWLSVVLLIYLKNENTTKVNDGHNHTWKTIDST